MGMTEDYISANSLITEAKQLMMQITIAQRRLARISSDLAAFGLSVTGVPLQPYDTFAGNPAGIEKKADVVIGAPFQGATAGANSQAEAIEAKTGEAEKAKVEPEKAKKAKKSEIAEAIEQAKKK